MAVTGSRILVQIDLAAAPPATGTKVNGIKTWNGTGWVVKPVKVWSGTAWVQKPLKRWSGTAWVAVEY